MFCKIKHKALCLKYLKYFIVILFPLNILANSPQITIVWSTENYNQDSAILSDELGNSLDAGIQGNGDGDLIELGYYSQASTSSPFEGEWIALSINTRVGDSSSGYGFNDGKFAFTSTFTKDLNTVTVFPTEPKVFIETLDFEITATSPPSGIPICVRFYDSPIKTVDTKYNAVTGANWTWPSFPSGSSVPSNYYWKIASGTPPAGSFWKYGNIFEDDSNPFTATISQSFNVRISLAPDSSAEMGTVVDINDTYAAGSYVDVNATALPHHEFFMWEGGTFQDPYSPNTRVFVDKNMEIRALIYPKIYYVDVPPSQMELVQGWGPFGYNSLASIFAESPLGYKFSHWEKDSEIVSLSNPFSFSVTEDLNLSANFTPLDYNISISSESGGSIFSVRDQNGLPATNFYHDANYTISIIPDKFYKFKKWISDPQTDNIPTALSDNKQMWNFSPDSNTSYTAEFELIENYLLINKGVGAESVTPQSDMFDAILGDISISATAMDGYEFSHWSDPYGLISELNESTTDLNVSKIDVFAEITANFKQITYTLDDINISSSIGGIYQLEFPNSGNFQHFGQYSITAVPDSGYRFDRWVGEGNTTNLSDPPSEPSNSLNINGPIQLTALFVPAEYQLHTKSVPEEGGYVSGGGGFSILDSLSVKAEASPFWVFDYWSGDIDFLVSPNAAISSLKWGDNSAPQDLNLTAHFYPRTINFDTEITGNGTLSYSLIRSDNVIESGNDLSHFNSNLYVEDNIFVDAIPANGWKFSHWLGLPDVDDLWSYNIFDTFTEVVAFSPTSDVELIANFTRKKYDLKVENLTSGGSSSGSGEYDFESTAQISATPLPNYKFEGWIGEDTQFLINSPLLAENSVSIPDRDLEIYAEFKPKIYHLNTSHDGNGNISHLATWVGNSHSLEDINGTSYVEITPNPNAGYVLESWIWQKSDGSNGTSYSNTFVIPSMDANYSVSATFKIPPTSLNFSLLSNISDAGIVEELSPLATLSKRTFRATAFDGYSFLGWSTDKPSLINPDWTSFDVEIELSDDTAITANFRKDPKKLIINYNDNFGVVDTNSSSTQVNNYSLQANPDQNYLFDSWELVKRFSFNVSRGFSLVKDGQTRLFIDDKESPMLTLIRGFTYNFQVNLDQNEEFFFSEMANTPFSNAYNNGITDNRTEDGTLIFDVPLDAPQYLYYNGLENLYSGNKIRVISINDSDIIPYPKNSKIDIVLPAPLEIQANFIPRELNLEKISNGKGAISSNLEKYYYNEEINITAIPDEHWMFTHWTGSIDIPERENPKITLQLVKDSQLVANFERIPYKLEIVSSPDFGDAYSVDNTYNYFYGDTVDIKAIPRAGKYFSHWSTPVLSNRQSLSETSFTMQGDTLLTAYFESNTYNMSYKIFAIDGDNNILPSEFGGFINAKDSYLDDDEAHLQFIMNDGFEFVAWRNNDDNTTISNEMSFKMLVKKEHDLNVLIKKKEYSVNLTTIPSQQGFISVNGQDYNETTTFSVTHGENLNLFANPRNGYAFQKWVSLGGLLTFPSKRSLNLTVKDDLQIVAYFSPLNDVTLNILVEPAESGWASGAGTFAYNPKHPITASPLRGWIFDRWMGNGLENELLDATNINLDGNKTIIAKFKEAPSSGQGSGDTSSIYVLLVTPSSTESGSVTGSGIYNEKWINISANPNDGYEFSHWEGEDIENPNITNTRIYVNSSKQVTAQFVIKGLLQESENVADKWWANPWFGSYWKQNNSNWILHEAIGWTYMRLENDQSIWMWVEKLDDWFWTSSTLFPYIYSTNSGWYWINLEKSSINKLYLYKYRNPEGWLYY